MVVLVPGERQAEALDGVGDEDYRPIVVDRFEGGDEARQVMTAEVCHQPRELLVRALVEEARDGTLVAEVILQALAPSRAALKGQGRVELVGAGIDPAAELLAARLAERFLLQRAVFQRHHLPAEGLEDRLEAGVEPLPHHCVEALTVVVDDPPGVPQPLLPALEQGLEDVSGQANQPLSDVVGLNRAPTSANEGSPQRTNKSHAKLSAPWSPSGGIISMMWPNTFSARGLAASSCPAWRSLLLVRIT